VWDTVAISVCMSVLLSNPCQMRAISQLDRKERYPVRSKWSPIFEERRMTNGRERPLKSTVLEMSSSSEWVQKAISDRVKELGLPLGKYVVVGGAMEVHGIRPAKDIDIVAAPDLFQELQLRGWEICHCNVCRRKMENSNADLVLRNPDVVGQVFSSYESGGVYRADTSEIIRSANIINGVPYVQLVELLKWKRASGRIKDQIDVALIERYLCISV
jgi:hypothetical protein